MKKREEVLKKYKWKIEDIYSSDNDWEKDYKIYQKKLNKYLEFKGNISNNFFKALNAYEEIAEKIEKIFVYAHLRKDEDNTNNKYHAFFDRAQNLIVQFESVTSFLIPEILRIPEKDFKKYLREEKFNKFIHFLKNLLRKKKHTLSEKEEKILALSGEIAQAPGQIFNMINNADIKFPKITDEEGNKVELTKGNFTKFMRSNNRNIRKDAFSKLYGTYSNQKNTIASTLSFSIKKDIYYSRIRKYNSTIEASLFADNIPLKVYDNLIKVINKNLGELKRYVSLKKEALNLKEMHIYDLYVPIIEPGLSYNYNEAKKIIFQSLKPLGKQYLEIIEEAFRNKWIDVMENIGKTSGAFSWGCYDTHPFILLNYQNTLDDVFTLAHELGHAAHSYLSNDNQHYINSGYSIFIAEIASTLNEIMLTKHLISKLKDKKTKLYLINNYLEQFRNTVFRQTMFAEFEKTVHEMAEEGFPLTVNKLSEIYLSLNKKYYGNIIVDKEIELEWSRIPHFYNSFYVYKYATGFSAACTLSEKILKEKNKAVKKYLEFLSGGGSDYPLNILKKAGIDMEDPQPIKNAVSSFSSLVNKFENLI